MFSEEQNIFKPIVFWLCLKPEIRFRGVSTQLQLKTLLKYLMSSVCIEPIVNLLIIVRLYS